MARFESEGLKFEVYGEILSGAYYGSYVELYAKNCTITLNVKTKEDAMKIYEEHNLTWEYK